jgi:hypothetical protein
VRDRDRRANATTLHPTNCYFIVDACLPSFAGQNRGWFTGNNEPDEASRWGDYFSVQRHTHVTEHVRRHRHDLRDGGANSNSEPHYVWFGRESERSHLRQPRGVVDAGRPARRSRST